MLTALSFYKCLADDTRLKSLLLIMARRELCVCDLTLALELSQPKVSRHLADLRKCGLLQDERRGKWVYYRIHPQLEPWKIEVLSKTLMECTSELGPVLKRLPVESKACE